MGWLQAGEICGLTHFFLDSLFNSFLDAESVCWVGVGGRRSGIEPEDHLKGYFDK